MGLGHELGLIKEGYLADLLLVAGDPFKDVTILKRRTSRSSCRRAVFTRTRLPRCAAAPSQQSENRRKIHHGDFLALSVKLRASVVNFLFRVYCYRPPQRWG